MLLPTGTGPTSAVGRAQFPTLVSMRGSSSLPALVLGNSWVTVKTKHEIPFPHAPSSVCPAGEQLQLCGSGHAGLSAPFFSLFCPVTVTKNSGIQLCEN